MHLCNSLLWIILIENAVLPSNALRITNMSAPKMVDFTRDMTLECHFDMGDEELYAVKWYKDDQEFFRYMPHQQPNTKAFPVAGVHLEQGRSFCGSNRCYVRLSNLIKVVSSGEYQCEVSSEAPAFRLVSGTHNILVAALPTRNPSIEGVNDSYYVGDILTAKCISPPSDPPQILTWYVNKQQVPEKFVRDTKTSNPDVDGLVTRSLLLRFAVEQKHSRSTNMELTCVSSFAGASETALTVTKSVALFDHNAQIVNNEKYYWNSSSIAHGYDLYVILLLGTVRWL